MKHRHKVHHHAKGGRTVYAGAESNVVKEAEETKRGGKAHGKHVGHVHGGKARHRYAHGGQVKPAHGGKVHRPIGHHGGGKHGGSDKHPFSSAHLKY